MKIGIIGGSGFDDPNLIENPRIIDVTTPLGAPSSALTVGKIRGVDVVIISRHGKNHEITPTNVNNRANIYALKEQGCTHLIATTAVGSLREDIRPGDLVILDNFIDFTKHRTNTFYDKFSNGPVHVSMAWPFDYDLRRELVKNCKEMGIRAHSRGTAVTIEGPRFSTIAESKMFQILGGHVINMSTAPEAALANEAELPYAVIAMSTDYDCWNPNEENVSWDSIQKVFGENVSKVKDLLVRTIESLSVNSEMLH
ncbi:S-methyl-5'-thioadenosine phosphorylase [Candidatus Pacearchaeota archaeon]|nr:S-methyl-5'-thioadenosine phosphorylase [Candidatus Pacearchaeota archaeon]